LDGVANEARFSPWEETPSPSTLFGALRVAHGQMHRLGQRVRLVGRDTKRGARLDHRRHELVPLTGAPVNRSVAQALDSDPGKSALEFREGRRRRSIAEFGRAREFLLLKNSNFGLDHNLEDRW
jgi:hypothetical protein